MDIAEFLEARWAERAAAARASGGRIHGDFEWSEVYPDRFRGLVGTACGNVILFETQLREHAAHIALNDPAAVLADIEAKRAVLQLYADTRAVLQRAEASLERGLSDSRDYLDAQRELAVLEPVARNLAAPFASHPDYQQEWSP